MSGLFDLGGLIDDLEGDEDFESRPVDIDTFMGKGYLEQTGITLSHHQKEMIERMTQIYKYKSLVTLYGEKEAKKIQSRTVREVVCMLGKGSGKDYIAEIACAYVVHKLMCLRDPAQYYGKPPGNAIDIINVAKNADQANNVFFKGLATMVRRSPYFKNLGVTPKSRVIEFPKSVTVYSGHSEAEAFEGYNTLMVILDEIAGFEHFAKDAEEEGVSPAQAIYDMYNDSVTSRFSENGKIILLSFPRQKGDFISNRYEEVVGEVNPIPYQHTYILNKNLPPDAPGNSFTIEWTIDDIVSYRMDNVWALRRPSWDVNPQKDIEEYKMAFFQEPAKSLGKFAAEPQESVGGFFSDHSLIDEFSNFNNGIDENNVFHKWFKPKDDDTRYFIHVDLARKHDRCVVAMAHVAGWRKTGMMGGMDEFVPVVKVDLIRYWTPSRDSQVDFKNVRDFIMDVIHRGFPVKKITFDQWQSDDMIKYFNRAGVESEVLSVGLPQYTDLKMIIHERRGEAPRNEILRRELKQLFITKNGKNVDHPRTSEGSKDISDAVAGAVYNAISLTPKKTEFDFEILNAEDFYTAPEDDDQFDLQINPPRKATSSLPRDIANYLDIELL